MSATRRKKQKPNLPSAVSSLNDADYVVLKTLTKVSADDVKNIESAGKHKYLKDLMVIGYASLLATKDLIEETTQRKLTPAEKKLLVYDVDGLYLGRRKVQAIYKDVPRPAPDVIGKYEYVYLDNLHKVDKSDIDKIKKWRDHQAFLGDKRVISVRWLLKSKNIQLILEEEERELTEIERKNVICREGQLSWEDKKVKIKYVEDMFYKPATFIPYDAYIYAHNLQEVSEDDLEKSSKSNDNRCKSVNGLKIIKYKTFLISEITIKENDIERKLDRDEKRKIVAREDGLYFGDIKVKIKDSKIADVSNATSNFIRREDFIYLDTLQKVEEDDLKKKTTLNNRLYIDSLRIMQWVNFLNKTNKIVDEDGMVLTTQQKRQIQYLDGELVFGGKKVTLTFHTPTTISNDTPTTTTTTTTTAAAATTTTTTTVTTIAAEETENDTEMMDSADESKTPHFSQEEAKKSHARRYAKNFGRNDKKKTKHRKRLSKRNELKETSSSAALRSDEIFDIDIQILPSPPKQNTKSSKNLAPIANANSISLYSSETLDDDDIQILSNPPIPSESVLPTILLSCEETLDDDIQMLPPQKQSTKPTTNSSATLDDDDAKMLVSLKKQSSAHDNQTLDADNEPDDEAILALTGLYDKAIAVKKHPQNESPDASESKNDADWTPTDHRKKRKRKRSNDEFNGTFTDIETSSTAKRRKKKKTKVTQINKNVMGIETVATTQPLEDTTVSTAENFEDTYDQNDGYEPANMNHSDVMVVEIESVPQQKNSSASTQVEIAAEDKSEKQPEDSSSTQLSGADDQPENAIQSDVMDVEVESEPKQKDSPAPTQVEAVAENKGEKQLENSSSTQLASTNDQPANAAHSDIMDIEVESEPKQKDSPAPTQVEAVAENKGEKQLENSSSTPSPKSDDPKKTSENPEAIHDQQIANTDHTLTKKVGDEMEVELAATEPTNKEKDYHADLAEKPANKTMHEMVEDQHMEVSLDQTQDNSTSLINENLATNNPQDECFDEELLKNPSPEIDMTAYINVFPELHMEERPSYLDDSPFLLFAQRKKMPGYNNLHNDFLFDDLERKGYK